MTVLASHMPVAAVTAGRLQFFFLPCMRIREEESRCCDAMHGQQEPEPAAEIRGNVGLFFFEHPYLCLWYASLVGNLGCLLVAIVTAVHADRRSLC